MKLSALKELIADVEANVLPENPDPNITFFKLREAADPRPGRLEATVFIEYDFVPPTSASEHRVFAIKDSNSVAKAGDFSYGLHVIPCFKE